MDWYNVFGPNISNIALHILSFDNFTNTSVEYVRMSEKSSCIHEYITKGGKNVMLTHFPDVSVTCQKCKIWYNAWISWNIDTIGDYLVCYNLFSKD